MKINSTFLKEIVCHLVIALMFCRLEKMISCKHFTENDLKLMEKYMDIAISATLPHAPSHPVCELALTQCFILCQSVFTILSLYK